MRLAALALAWLLVAAPAAAQGTPDQTVRDFVAAYNDRDFERFGSLLQPGARWYSVEGEKVSVEGEGREALVTWTTRYLTVTCTTCRSELVSVSRTGPYVTTVERATWTRDGQARQQSGVAVYEVREGLIVAVWYFPAA